ncbi:MAG: SusC/RagA family TonB-linked outer membrane protein, partial [Tannerella sp.]|nr:SusC/RagA family TonB-linked outer membrane protein [Tannerella sp.]
ERLFIDANDVANSARQNFSRYEAGDIKYKDMNGDNVIDELDQVPIGYPETPEINYGFGLSAGYKNVDFSFFFSGSARNTFFISPGDMNPFIRSTVDGIDYEGGLAKFIADDYWTEQSQNPYALWPRLTDVTLSNNTQRSTWYMYNGDFLRLKSMELGYSMPAKLASKLKLSSFRIYASGTNLLLFSKFKLWDVELGGNGLNYPLQRVLNVGINLSF